jgi:hypothetical protein
MKLLYITEIQIVSTVLLMALSIAGLLFTAIFILYNLNNIYAIQIKGIIRTPYIYLKRNKNISEFIVLIHHKLIIPVLPVIKKIKLFFIYPLFSIAVLGIKKTGNIIHKFDSIYLNNALNNIEESILFIGLIARKIHSGDLKTYTMYLLAFIVIFYFIFRTM